MSKSSLLCVVTARRNSKRVPSKNLRMLSGLPLVLWSVNLAKKIQGIKDILVSTDDENIAKICLDHNVMVPWLRPPELSGDASSSVDVCIHALDWYEKSFGEVDGLLLLQPTSPFRTRESVEQGIHLFHGDMSRPIVGVSKAKSHPYWCYEIKENYMIPYVSLDHASYRSQDLPGAYVINGAFYLISPKNLRQHRSFIQNGIPLVMNGPGEFCDIDTEEDWQAAELIANDFKNSSKNSN